MTEPKVIVRYDAMTDTLVPVTQEWVDSVQRALRVLVGQRREIHRMTERGALDLEIKP